MIQIGNKKSSLFVKKVLFLLSFIDNCCFFAKQFKSEDILSCFTSGVYLAVNI